MSDVHDRVDCSAADDTSRLFSTENGIHKGAQPPTESHNTSRTFGSLHMEISRDSQASSLRPLSNKLEGHREWVCSLTQSTLLLKNLFSPRIVQKSQRAVAHDSFRLAASPGAIQLFSPQPPQKQAESASARGAADSTTVSLVHSSFVVIAASSLLLHETLRILGDASQCSMARNLYVFTMLQIKQCIALPASLDTPKPLRQV